MMVIEMHEKPVQVMPLPLDQVKSLRKVHLLVIQVLVLLYQKQLQWKMALFDLATVQAHPNMQVVLNPRRY